MGIVEALSVIVKVDSGPLANFFVYEDFWARLKFKT